MEIQTPEITKDTIEADYVQQIMRDMKNGVMAVDKTGKILYVNPQMATFLESSDLTGTSLHTLITENARTENDTFWDAIFEATYQHKQQDHEPQIAKNAKYILFHEKAPFFGTKDRCPLSDTRIDLYTV